MYALNAATTPSTVLTVQLTAALASRALMYGGTVVCSMQSEDVT
jgi:hypothetical protein